MTSATLDADDVDAIENSIGCCSCEWRNRIFCTVICRNQITPMNIRKVPFCIDSLDMDALQAHERFNGTSGKLSLLW